MYRVQNQRGCTGRNRQRLMTDRHDDNATTTAGAETYLNPVHRRDFPDPFVLKFGGEYWAYCTGFWSDGRCFGVMHSRDLVNWRELGGALKPLPGEHPCYWAPEVVYENGRFLMYYSVGNEKQMHIRVAVAEHPAGPFVDSGRQLTTEEFAIDAHVFVDADGTRYLFYATDFLTHTHIGTGTVCDRMIDDFTLAGEARPVTRAKYDWQVYDPHRIEKGGVRWHTVEGPFVLHHKNRYYEMFSGGNWQNISYGVSYALSDRIETEDEWEQVADGQRVLPILRTLPEKVIGPGHNSVARAPDNQQLFCIYHRWAGESGRVLAIDRLDWVGERMIVLGPSTTPQPAPNVPAFADFFDEERTGKLGDNWECAGGRWSVRAGEARQEATEGKSEAFCRTHTESFVVELSLRALSDEEQGGGSFGVSLACADEAAWKFTLVPGTGEAVICWGTPEGGWMLAASIKLPASFNPKVFHLLRVEVDQGFICVALDDVVVRWQGQSRILPDRIALLTESKAAAFKGFALTIGWQDLFTGQEQDVTARGWQPEKTTDSWLVVDEQLRHLRLDGDHATVWKGVPLQSYELIINVKLEAAGAGGVYGFYPMSGFQEERSALLTVERHAQGGWKLLSRDGDEKFEFSLPEIFDPFVYQQFRFRKQSGRLTIQWESEVLGEIKAEHEPTRIGLYAHCAIVAFDMVRVTEIA